MTLAIRTPMTPGDALDAIADAYEAVAGGEIPARMLLVLAAQSALETAQWKSCWSWNFGNLRGSGDAGSVAIPGATEVINGVEVQREEGFAAYSGRIAGASAYLSLLERKYPKAIGAAMLGDLDGFVHSLKQGGYFTANEDLYDKAERSEAAWLEGLPAMRAWLEPHT